MQAKKIDYFKYRAFIFFVFVLSVICAVLGVAYFRNIYYIFTVMALGYTLLKYTQMMFIVSYALYRFEEAVHSFRKRQQQNHTSFKQITNVYILPNFNEDEEMLKETILTLSKHTRAKSYCLFLAMEKHEINSQQKAKKLVQQYSQHFRFMSYTIHELQPGESKSKSSNINWCGVYMYPKLLENYVNLDTVMITVMDSDSLISQVYVDQVQRHIQQNYDRRHTFIYQPPQIFARNQKDALFIVRVMDTLMSYMQISNLYSIFNYTMGVSNYTMSYRLLQRIGFWDTCKYSKGEDIRIPSKAVWKTEGEVRMIPIYVPSNQLNLTTNEGWWADIKARFVQARRHSEDQVEISYNFVSCMQSKVSFIRKFHILFTIFEVYAMLITIPVPGLVLVLQDIAEILPRSVFDDGSSFIIFNNISTIIMLICFSIYHIIKKRACKALYGTQPLNYLYTLQTIFLQLPGAVIFGFIPMIQASINLLLDNITFTVTPKGKSELKAKNSNLTEDVESIFQPEEIEQKKLFQKGKEEAVQMPNQTNI